MEKLTAKQERVLKIIAEKIGKDGLAPTFQELADELGVASKNAVSKHLAQLRHKGYIAMKANRPRTIQLLEPKGLLDGAEEIRLPLLGTITAGATMLAEENIGYHFVDGQLQRRGRPQTQKSVQRLGAVLANSRLARVRAHFNKARKFFDERPEPDAENCVKEAVCALEASAEIFTGKPASRDFDRVIRQLQGNKLGEIPPPIAEGMIKLRAYRGGAQGVAHAALQGSTVSEIEAELVLSLVAAYITYLYDLFLQEEEEGIPF